MTFYDNLNSAMDYLEDHLEGDLDYQALAKQVGTSLGTLQRLFPLCAGLSLTDYVRHRRLTLAGKDLAQTDTRVIDVAFKYGYDSAVAFSRAFQKFHGVKPSAVKSHQVALKHYPKLIFQAPKFEPELDYEIIKLPQLQLYGRYISTDGQHIKRDAPQLYLDLERDYPDLPHPDYGMVNYLDTREVCEKFEYWVLWQTPRPGTVPYCVPASRWLKLRIPSQESYDIQCMSDHFYENFLPTCNYQLKLDPELEHYHDGVTDFLIPIR